jgi:hypothetical protein
MALTPGGTPYVESSDLVADYPTVSLALAEHIDDLPAKILQIVRATDSTVRNTTSTSFVDAGISVTITPQKSDSAIIVFHAARTATPVGNLATFLQITDASNNPLSGAENHLVRDGNPSNINIPTAIFGYATPATTSPVTYKVRFSVNGGTGSLENSAVTGQLFAIEVSA